MNAALTIVSPKRSPIEAFLVVAKFTTLVVNRPSEKDLGRTYRDWWLLRREGDDSLTLLADYSNRQECIHTCATLIQQRTRDEALI